MRVYIATVDCCVKDRASRRFVLGSYIVLLLVACAAPIPEVVFGDVIYKAMGSWLAGCDLGWICIVDAIVVAGSVALDQVIGEPCRPVSARLKHTACVDIYTCWVSAAYWLSCSSWGFVKLALVGPQAAQKYPRRASLLVLMFGDFGGVLFVLCWLWSLEGPGGSASCLNQSVFWSWYWKQYKRMTYSQAAPGGTWDSQRHTHTQIYILEPLIECEVEAVNPSE